MDNVTINPGDERGDKDWHGPERCPCRPKSMLIYLTRKCNLECIMCTTVREQGSPLPYAAFRNLWPFISSADRLQWQGGEVFLVDYFDRLLAGINDEFPHITHYITTNGLLIDGDRARLLAGVNAELTFSIDSVVKSTYESIRIGGNFDVLLERLERVRDEYYGKNPTEKVTLALHAVVMRRTVRELTLFPEFCKKYGIRELRFLYLHPQLVPEEYLFDRDDEKRDLLRVIGDVENKCREFNINFDYFFRHLLAGDSSGVRMDRTSIGNRSREDLKCTRPWTRLFIDTSGSVMPSCECAVPAGNILKSPIEEIWNGEILRTYRKKLEENDYEGWCSERCVRGLTNI